MNGAVWCGVVVQIWFVRTAYLMDGSVDTKMWLIFIVVENVTERVELMWTCGLEYTHVSFVRAVSCKHSSSSSSSSSYKALQPSRKHYNLQTPLLQLIYKTRFWMTAIVVGGQCQTGRGRYDWLWRVAVLFTSERESLKEREIATSQCHAQQALTPSVTYNGAKKMNVYCKNERKLNGNCI